MRCGQAAPQPVLALRDRQSDHGSISPSETISERGVKRPEGCRDLLDGARITGKVFLMNADQRTDIAGFVALERILVEPFEKGPTRHEPAVGAQTQRGKIGTMRAQLSLPD